MSVPLRRVFANIERPLRFIDSDRQAPHLPYQHADGVARLARTLGFFSIR